MQTNCSWLLMLTAVWASYKWCNSPCWEVQMSVSESSVKFSEECSVFWHWHDQRNNQLVMLATLKWSEYNQDLFLYSITPTGSCLLLIINNIYNIDNRDKYVSQYHWAPHYTHGWKYPNKMLLLLNTELISSPYWQVIVISVTSRWVGMAQSVQGWRYSLLSARSDLYLSVLVATSTTFCPYMSNSKVKLSLIWGQLWKIVGVGIWRTLYFTILNLFCPIRQSHNNNK